MSGANNITNRTVSLETESATIDIDPELDDWILAAALSHGKSKNAAAIEFLQHGCKNHEEILD